MLLNPLQANLEELWEVCSYCYTELLHASLEFGATKGVPPIQLHDVQKGYLEPLKTQALESLIINSFFVCPVFSRPSMICPGSAATMSSQLVQEGLMLIPQGLVLARQAANETAPTELPQQSLDLSSYPTSGLQTFGLFLIIFFPALSLVLVGLRVYDRARTKTIGIDDWFIITATVCCCIRLDSSHCLAG